MSEPTSETTPAEPAPLDFDKAEPGAQAGPAGADGEVEHVQCGLCARPITVEYWQALGKILCADCRAAVERQAASTGKGATFAKALLVGGGAALGCGIGYAVFVGVSKIQFALVTIGIGWAVGRSIQRVTRGFGGVKYQVLAVALTYFASSMGYLPAVFKGIFSGADHGAETAASAAPSSSPSSSSTDPPPVPGRAGELPSPPATPPAAAAPPSVARLALSLVALTGIAGFLMLAAPFLELGEGLNGLLGLAIIFFGMRTAWRISKGVVATVTGPHRLATAAGA
jgi:hypothetical protein